VGEKTLVESQFVDAIALIRKLDSVGTSPAVALWYFYDEIAEWRFILAGTEFDKLLPKDELRAYRMVVEAMAATSPSSLKISDIKLVRTDTALVKALRRLIRTGSEGVVQMHFANCTLNDVFIKEMVVLRCAGC